MTTTRWLGLLVALAGTAMVGENGCGASVPSCATVCEFADAPAGCVTTCDQNQSAATAVGASADFQAYLTCVNNAGSFTQAAKLCASSAETVATETQTAVLQPGDGDGAGSGDDGGTMSVGVEGDAGSCANASCDTVCAMAGNPAGCPAECSALQTECSNAAEQVETVLVCLCESGGWFNGTSTNTPCAAPLIALAQDCTLGGGR